MTPANPIARRWFLQQCGLGLGAMSLAHLLGAESQRLHGREPARPEAAALPQQDQVGHLPVHGRRPQPSGTVRPQAGAGQVGRQAAPAELLQGYRSAFINPNSKLLGPKFKFARHGQTGAELSEVLPHLATVADDLCIVKSTDDRCLQPRPGPDHDVHRRAAVRPAQPGGVVDLRPGQHLAGTARLRRLQRRGAKAPPAATPTGAAASCRPCTRACSSAPAATPSCSSPTPEASMRNCKPTPSERPEVVQPDAVGSGRRPRDRHADQRLRNGLQDAVERPRPDGPEPRAGQDDADVRGRAGQKLLRQHLRASPPAWWSAACASCRSSTRPGTSTATWSTA